MNNQSSSQPSFFSRLGSRALFLLPVVAIALFLAWFRLSPVTVTGFPVSVGAVVVEVMGRGTLEARTQATISPKIAGRLREVSVDQGEVVTAGQIIAVLDDADLRQQVAIVEAGLVAAEATAKRIEADIVQTKAVYEQAYRDHQRNRKLLTDQILSNQTVEKSQETLAVALAGQRRAEAALHESRSQIAVARNTLEYHRAKLADTVVKAPFPGLVVRRDREPGDVVVPGSSICLLVATDTIWVRAWVDETRMKDLAVGQIAHAVFPAEPRSRYPGRVARLGRDTDRETREFVVDIAIEKLPENWAVGQRADVFIESARKENTVVVAARFLERKGDLIQVLLVKDSRALRQPVHLGLQGRDTVEILDLAAGSTIIDPTRLPKRFREGARVRLITSRP